MYNDLFNKIDNYIKLSYIKEMPNGKWRILSKDNKNLGEYSTKSEAKDRLQQIEYFKHKDDNNVKDDKIIDLTKIDNFSYSAIMRELKKYNKECFLLFLKKYKEYFDEAMRKNLEAPEKLALQKSIIDFAQEYKIKLSKDLIKNAAVSELGDAKLDGKYLSDIIKFTLTRINEK